MVSNNKFLIEIIAGKALAKPTPPQAALAVVNESLAKIADALEIASRCGHVEHLARYEAHEVVPEGFLERARNILDAKLPSYAKMHGAWQALSDVALRSPWEPITRATAVTMLSALSGALNKRRADSGEHAGWLLACADMFSPINQTIGEASRLWVNVSRHPIVLALAVQLLLARNVHTPMPTEVREAMAIVQKRLAELAGGLEERLCAVERADEIVFAHDRAAWDRIYAELPRPVVSAMLESADRFGQSVPHVSALYAWDDVKEAEGRPMIKQPTERR